MKRILYLIVLLSSINFNLSWAGEIPFLTGTLQDALNASAETKKLIFVDAYTTWCGPCKWMAKNVFTNDAVADFYGNNFVCIKLDMEKGEGVEFAQKYKVEAYPTFVFLNSDGQKVHQVCGSRDVEKFMAVAKQALSPETQLITFEERYEAGERELGFLKSYIKTCMEANIDATQFVSDLLRSEATGELINATDFEMIANSSELGNEPFEFIMNYREKYEQVLEKQKLNEFITTIFLQEAVKAAKKDSPELLAQALVKAEEYHFENYKELTLNMNWRYAQISKKNILESAQSFINGFKLDDPEELNNAAWTIFENYSDKNSLTIGAEWAKLSVKLKKGYANTDTYANLLFKIGDSKNALLAANESLDLGKKNEEDTVATENLIKEIQASTKKGKK